MSRREPTVSITVRFPKALAGRLGERARQDHQSVSTLLRRYAELGLNGEDYARQTDPLQDIIGEEITHSVRQQTDRIAAMLNRLTILSASAYYANLAFVTAFVDQDRYTSFEKIERRFVCHRLKHSNVCGLKSRAPCGYIVFSGC